MEGLKETWLTDGTVDFEYKKYVLLAYLQKVKHSFFKNELYPPLAELINHYNNLIDIRNNKKQLADNQPKRIKSIDFEKLRIHYKRLITDDDLMQELNDIIEYALPLFKEKIEVGTEIYDFVEANLMFDAVGLIPIYNKEGYLLILAEEQKDVSIFRYQVSMVNQAGDPYSAIRTAHLGTEEVSISNNIQHIKMSLIKQHPELPNPATYLISAKLDFPVFHTVLPIAKRLLLREVAAA